MNQKSLIEMILLASLWGSSFLFMRIGSPELGPILFMALRTLTASVFLFPLMVLKKQTSSLTGQWGKMFVLGALNTAIPFALFGYAVLTLSAGVTSVLNATTPMCGAIVAYLWLKDKLSPGAIFGLLLGFAGVYFLVSDKLHANADAIVLPTLAVIGATLCYGIAANFTKHYFSHVKPLALAAGSQISASIILLPLSLFFLPNAMPSEAAIYSVVFLGIFCTGLAYILFFRLIADLGPTKAISVTYLIPVFGLLWGFIFLDEQITESIIIGCIMILSGVGLTTGVFSRWRK
ncbi:DMT family transporter [Thalassotalea atypica]|uniref:DMT family transporter n=1 Tax=Thalassotalea atypica TaxID=2054316 RepID=UPI0025726D09|nr:DMT family transporter [Thalassotalea atypica]